MDVQIKMRIYKWIFKIRETLNLILLDWINELDVIWDEKYVRLKETAIFLYFIAIVAYNFSCGFGILKILTFCASFIASFLILAYHKPSTPQYSYISSNNPIKKVGQLQNKKIHILDDKIYEIKVTTMQSTKKIQHGNIK